MNELDSILDAWQGLHGSRRDAVLATVVHVTGSAYRQPGARMLLIPDGQRIGSVSGGCLEGEIARKAWWYTEGAPEVRVYDTTSDDDAVWEFGLGCNGIVHVLLERVESPEAARMLAFLNLHRVLGQAAVVATVIRAEAGCRVAVGERLLVTGDGQRSGALAGTAMEAPVLQQSLGVLRGKRSVLVALDDCDVFVEFVGRPLSLVVFGAGQDAVPLVHMAVGLGWDVTVADGRPAYAKADRFPGASHVLTMQAQAPLEGIAISRETAVVMMTHNYPMDRRLLPLVLERAPRYLGLLGPKTRATRLLNELGLDAPAYLHAPAGLDVGGEAPPAIALAITAEIQAASADRPGGMLRYRRGAIHEPALELGGRKAAAELRTERPGFCETGVGSYV